MVAQPLGFRGELRLHNYQLQALSWMISFEKNPGLPLLSSRLLSSLVLSSLFYLPILIIYVVFIDTSAFVAWRSRSSSTIMNCITKEWTTIPLAGTEYRSRGTTSPPPPLLSFPSLAFLFLLFLFFLKKLLGGILADDMGLGKTMVVIGLILANLVPPIDLSNLTNGILISFFCFFLT